MLMSNCSLTTAPLLLASNGPGTELMWNFEQFGNYDVNSMNLESFGPIESYLHNLWFMLLCFNFKKYWYILIKKYLVLKQCSQMYS